MSFNPNQTFYTGTITREDIVGILNASYGTLFTIDDNRLTDSICAELAMLVGKLNSFVLEAYVTNNEKKSADLAAQVVKQITSIVDPLIKIR